MSVVRPSVFTPDFSPLFHGALFRPIFGGIVFCFTVFFLHLMGFSCVIKEAALVEYFHGPSFRFFRKQDFGFLPGMTKQFGGSIVVQRGFVFPVTVGKQHMWVVGLAQQLHVHAPGKSANLLLALLKHAMDEGIYRVLAEGHFYNSFYHGLC